MKTKILLTGSSGMVGSNIVEHKYFKKYQMLTPTSSELNLLNPQNIRIYLETNKPEMIIHAAGIVGGIEANIKYPVKFLVDNMQMGLNILMEAKNQKIKKFINLSSSCMYPKNAKNPLSEDFILKGELETTNEAYALAKLATTKLCEYVSREDRAFKYKTVIPCNLYGKYDNFNLDNSHMIPGVIKRIFYAKKNNLKSLDIWGDGTARREFMYAADFADFIYYAIENFMKMPQNINVGIGTDYSISDYYSKIAKVVGFKGLFNFDLSKPIGMKQKLVDDKRLKKFGWVYQISLDEGIKNTYKYFIDKINQ